MDKIATSSPEKYPRLVCTANSFEIIQMVGQGTFGEVYKAKNVKTNEFVALKKVLYRKSKYGYPITTLREIKILRQLDHKHVVRLIDISEDGTIEIFLAFEYMEHDLTGLLANKEISFSIAEKKHLIMQLIEGMNYVHVKNFMHRDLKSSNILISDKGWLRLADFGLAKQYCSTETKYTNTVVTLWYRAPELLYGARNYGLPIDMWAVGLITAEVFMGEPLLKGMNEMTQLSLIEELCGTIDESSFPGVSNLVDYKLVKNRTKNPTLKRPNVIRKTISVATTNEAILDFIEDLLKLDPAERLTSKEAMHNRIFWDSPTPVHPKHTFLKINKPQKEYDEKKTRLIKRPNLDQMDDKPQRTYPPKLLGPKQADSMFGFKKGQYYEGS